MRKLLTISLMLIALTAPAQDRKWLFNRPAASGGGGGETNNPMGEWKLDGNAYDSVGTNNGTTYNATWGTGKEGLANTAMSCNGNNTHMELLSGSLLPTNDFTLSVWFNKTNNTPASQTPILFFKTVTGPNIQISAYNVWGCYLKNDAGQLLANFSGDKTIVTGSWTHVVLTVSTNGSLARAMLYINGIQDYDSGNQTSTGHWLASSVQSLGGFGGGGPMDGEPFNGLIDEIRIYNRALSSNEVWQSYNAEKP